jgi:hypothetical protein
VLIHDARPVAVLWAAMAVADLDEAIESLATREGIVNENIRCSIVVWSAGRVSRHIEREVIAEWARAKNITAVVWTALKPGPANNSVEGFDPPSSWSESRLPSGSVSG